MLRINQILFDREINALRVTIIFRLIFLFSMVFGTPFGGKSNLESILVAALCGPTLIFSIFSMLWLRRKTRVRLVGIVGSILDVIIIASLPVIWYYSVGGPAVAPAYMIKGPLYHAFLWGILAYNSFAIQPVYLLIVIIGGACSVGGHFLYLVLEGSTTFTSDFIAHNLDSAVSPWFTFVSLTVYIAAGVGLVIFALKVKKTIYSAARNETAANQLSRFFSPKIRDELMSENNPLASERGNLQDVSVLFSDIRNFTAFCEATSPQNVVAFLKEYHSIMIDIIFKHHGTLDKFIGDGIMATFGTPTPSGDDAINSLQAAMEMSLALKNLNERRSADGQKEIRIGIGIHYGPVIAGNIGNENRLEYTVIGDTVNIASRLENATKELRREIVFSEELKARVEKEIPVAPLGTIKIRGRERPISVYTVHDMGRYHH